MFGWSPRAPGASCWPTQRPQLSEKNCSITIENPTNTSKFGQKSSSFDKVKRNKQSPKLTLEKCAHFAERNSIESSMLLGTKITRTLHNILTPIKAGHVSQAPNTWSSIIQTNIRNFLHLTPCHTCPTSHLTTPATIHQTSPHHTTPPLYERWQILWDDNVAIITGWIPIWKYVFYINSLYSCTAPQYTTLNFYINAIPGEIISIMKSSALEAGGASRVHWILCKILQELAKRPNIGDTPHIPQFSQPHTRALAFPCLKSLI